MTIRHQSTGAPCPSRGYNLAMPGTLEGIWLKHTHRGSMAAVEAVRTIARSGLDGNINQGGRRQVTLLAAECWQDVQRDLGRRLDPALRRANLLVAGLDLENSRDKVVLIGSVPILIHGETKPCARMDKVCPGLRQRLSGRWRGGAYGEILADGEIRIGDPVTWLGDSSNASAGKPAVSPPSDGA